MISQLDKVPKITESRMSRKLGRVDPHRFIFDLDAAILGQILQTLRESPWLPLVRDVGPNKRGVYAIFLKGRVVFVGKALRSATPGKQSIRERLNEHVAKVADRPKLPPHELNCQFLTIKNDRLVGAAECRLINFFKPEWNDWGFDE